jgi:hypothetical protein
MSFSILLLICVLQNTKFLKFVAFRLKTESLLFLFVRIVSSNIEIFVCLDCCYFLFLSIIYEKSVFGIITLIRCYFLY